MSRIINHQSSLQQFGPFPSYWILLVVPFILAPFEFLFQVCTSHLHASSRLSIMASQLLSG